MKKLNEFWQDHKIRVMFTMAVFIVITIASYYGQNYRLVKVTEQFKADSIQVENKAEAKIKDTVQVKNREIKNLVSVMKEEEPRKLVKVINKDTLIILRIDSTRKDSMN